MKYIKNYLLVILIFQFFSGCFGPSSVEEQKKDCLSQNKTFDSLKALNYRTGKIETRIICK